LIALALASKLFRHIPTDTDVVSPLGEARSLIAYGAPISIYQLINAFIARLDLLMLGYFVGRAPGVTLATVGVYSAVIGTANGLHSSITCVVAFAGLLWLIPRFGPLGAAVGILLPYVVQGILRYATLRWVFHWKDSWSDISRPLTAAAIAIVPALICRGFLNGVVGQITSAAVFLAVFGV